MTRIPFPEREASFFRGGDGSVLFQFIIDERNVIGPRAATEADKLAHPRAWVIYVAENAAEDHERYMKSNAKVESAVKPEPPPVAPAPVVIVQMPPSGDMGHFNGAEPVEQAVKALADKPPRRTYTRRQAVN